MPTVSPKRAKNEDPYENRAVFVDEFTCIGCKQCIWQAPATFRIEPEHGRSRVYAQCRVQLVAKDVLLHPINGRHVGCMLYTWAPNLQVVPNCPGNSLRHSCVHAIRVQSICGHVNKDPNPRKGSLKKVSPWNRKLLCVPRGDWHGYLGISSTAPACKNKHPNPRKGSLEKMSPWNCKLLCVPRGD
eukprot:1136742-Pelagomonas_calceolata.AAC.4